MTDINLIVDPDTELLTIRKHPGESFIRFIDVSRYMRPGDAILSVDDITFENLGKVAGSSDITITNITHNSAAEIQARFAGGTEDENYKIKASWQTSDGDQLEADMMLWVREDF